MSEVAYYGNDSVQAVILTRGGGNRDQSHKNKGVTGEMVQEKTRLGGHHTEVKEKGRPLHDCRPGGGGGGGGRKN